MKSLTSTILTGCAVVLFTAERAEGLKCYVCAGVQCDHDKEEMDNCTSCTKVSTFGLVTKKMCSSIKVEDGCKEKLKIATCFCSTDLCNGSTNMASSAMILGALTAACLLFRNL